MCIPSQCIFTWNWVSVVQRLLQQIFFRPKVHSSDQCCFFLPDWPLCPSFPLSSNICRKKEFSISSMFKENTQCFIVPSPEVASQRKQECRNNMSWPLSVLIPKWNKYGSLVWWGLHYQCSYLWTHGTLFLSNFAEVVNMQLDNFLWIH